MWGKAWEEPGVWRGSLQREFGSEAPGRCTWCCPVRVLGALFVLVLQGPSLCGDSFPAVKPCTGKGVWMTHTVTFSHGWLMPFPSETSLQLGYSLLPTNCC